MTSFPLPAALRSVLAAGLDLVLPRVCAGCGEPGRWCRQCARTVAGPARRLALPDVYVDVCSGASIPAPPVYALARYSGPVRAAILAGKERGRRDILPVLGDACGGALYGLQRIGAIPSDVWLVPAPSRRAAARARGGDPVTAMARAAARRLAESGLPTGVAPYLYTARRARDSVGLSALERAANLAGAIRCDERCSPPSGADIVILDDVFTSGATAGQSALVLHHRGFRPVAVLVIAGVPPHASLTPQT